MNHGFFEAQRAAEANLEKSQVDPGDECSLEISYLEHTPIGGTAEVELQFDVDDERQPGTARRTDDDAGHLVSGTGSLTEESADDLPLGMRYGPGVLEMVKADRLKMEHMASSAPDPSLSSEKLTRRTRLGEADAFISHSWSDDPAAKWNLDRIDQSDFKNSLATRRHEDIEKSFEEVRKMKDPQQAVHTGTTEQLQLRTRFRTKEVIILPDPEHRIADRILDFDPCNLQCNSKAETAAARSQPNRFWF
eukprot:Skav234374  [mRNA]  locus=scaffold2071:143552:154176:- [translate_table: standard]